MHRVKVHLFEGSGVIGCLIRWRTWRKYAHAAIEIDGMLYEAVENPFPNGGVIKNDVSESWIPGRQKPSLTLVSETLSDSNVQSMTNFLEECVGKKYDYWAVLAFISRRKERISSKDKYFCSELVCEAFKWIDKPLFNNLHCRKVSPGLIANSIRLKELK
jgi:hypothetical protein